MVLPTCGHPHLIMTGISESLSRQGSRRPAHPSFPMARSRPCHRGKFPGITSGPQSTARLPALLVHRRRASSDGALAHRRLQLPSVERKAAWAVYPGETRATAWGLRSGGPGGARHPRDYAELDQYAGALEEEPRRQSRAAAATAWIDSQIPSVMTKYGGNSDPRWSFDTR
jgi:hypothetical protein